MTFPHGNRINIIHSAAKVKKLTHKWIYIRTLMLSYRILTIVLLHWHMKLFHTKAGCPGRHVKVASAAHIHTLRHHPPCCVVCNNVIRFAFKLNSRRECVARDTSPKGKSRRRTQRAASASGAHSHQMIIKRARTQTQFNFGAA
jgi:hypothetical protein